MTHWSAKNSALALTGALLEIQMAGKPSAMQLAAKKQWEAAPADKKPTASELARKHKLSDIAIYQADWWKKRNSAQPQPGEK